MKNPSFLLKLFTIFLTFSTGKEMGNCQAIDDATLAIQHPNGRVDKLYWPVAASEIMRMNPGHYVALLLTTTLYPSTAAAPAAAAAAGNNNNLPLRVTRIKLLRPTDTLVLGHAYRLVTSQELMKGSWAKRQAKMAATQSSDVEAVVQRPDVKKADQGKQRRHGARNNTPQNSATSKSRSWQPALKSISEAAT